LHLIHETVGEQRADGAVDQARGQGFLFAGPAFALEEAARDLAYGVGLLDVMHGQGKEVLAGLRGLFGHYGAQYRGVLDGHED